MYLKKGTTISYRVVSIKYGKDKNKQMILVDKDIFESMITMSGLEKKEQTEE
jgi:hypothetical protein